MPGPADTGGSRAGLAPNAPRSRDARWTDWRWQHAHAARTPADVEALFPGRFDVSAAGWADLERAAALYAMRATPYYLDLARRADASDPVWALAVPSAAETVVAPEERVDPIGDEEPHLSPGPALVRRYRDRVLLMPTPTCSVHCRHCFRKRLVGRAEYAPSADELDAAVRWIAGEPELHEVILTGGDPLTLSDARLVPLLERLAALPHIWTLRLHTRMPVVNPFRITPELAAALGRLPLPVFVVAHFNHPVELTDAARRAAARLGAAGVSVLNQSVLLAGINADPDTHRELLWALVRAGIRPYALHHADLVPGTGHLRTDLATGRRLMRALRGTVPGHALPQYLLDVPGGHGKVPVDGGWVGGPDADGRVTVHAPDGSFRPYPPDLTGSPGRPR